MKDKSLLHIWFQKRGSYLVISLFALLFMTGCSSDDDDTVPVAISYTTLIYMAADNSLDSDVDYTIAKIKEGAKKSVGTAVIYVDRKEASPRLFKVNRDGTETVLKSYEEENSADAETLVRVIQETKQLVPSETFGLVIWSHSMGWYPATYIEEQTDESVRLKYVAIDENPDIAESSISFMEVDDMAKALPDKVAEYIWFDVCLMGTVEGLYEFRRKADYLVASPTEVLFAADYDASGVPYAKVLPLLFGGKNELTDACKIYYRHYNEMKYEILRSASITLIDAKELDGLYAETEKILSGKLLDIENMTTEGIQTYHTKNIPQIFFDFANFIKVNSTTEQYSSFEKQLSRVVLYKAATATFMVSADNKFSIDPAKFSGLSVYIPLLRWKGTNDYRYYFSRMEWSEVYGE